MMAQAPRTRPAPRRCSTYLGSAGRGEHLRSRPTQATSAPNKQVDTSGYNALQKKSAEIIGDAKNIAQFLDRDTRPDFASTVMIPALQTFIKNPNDIDGLTNSIEKQKKSIFAS